MMPSKTSRLDGPQFPVDNWPNDYSQFRCGHNYEIARCPYQECVSQELMKALESTLGVVQAQIVNAEQRNDHASIIRGLTQLEFQVRATLAKAKGHGIA